MTDLNETAMTLIAEATTAKIAAEIGAPRLALASARRASATAAELTIALSPLLAKTPPALERQRLGSARSLEDLVAVRWPPPPDPEADDLDRAGAS